MDAPGLPRFWGGLVGYLGYDMVRFIERLPELTPALTMPEARLMLADNLLIFDNLRQTIKVMALVHLDPDAPPAGPVRPGGGGHRGPDPAAGPTGAAQPGARRSPRPPLTSNLTQERFEAMVEQAKEYIAAGDVIQVVLSQRFQTPLRHDPFDLYRALRCINPSPYMFYLDQGDMKVVGASPEILVRLEEGRITYRPIAGTRPRGATEAEDRELETELLADPKERAEHLMLVDLGRNDVGRVAKIGSVRVPELFTVERYSHVMHIVSQVEGELAPGLRRPGRAQVHLPGRHRHRRPQGAGHGDHRGAGAHPPGAVRRGGGLSRLRRQPGLLHHHPQLCHSPGPGVPASGGRHRGRFGPGQGIPGDGEQGHGPGAGPGPGGGRIDVKNLGEPRFFRKSEVPPNPLLEK